MNKTIRQHIEHLASTDDKIRLDALQTLLKVTDSKVDWIYDVWDDLLEKLDNENSYQRSIGIMLLCNLAKSDREDRLRSALDRILVHTKDEKFITSRQCIQNIWKAAATTQANREKVLKHLKKRYLECSNEKHSNLLRQDVIQSMVLLSRQEDDHSMLADAQALIVEETDMKNRKKYEALLRSEIHS
jgi:hypothetical protein